MRCVKWIAAGVFGVLLVGRVHAQSDFVPVLIETRSDAGSLTPADRAYLDRYREARYVDWMVPIRVDASALDHDVFDVELQDRRVRICRQAPDTSQRSPPEAWYGVAMVDDCTHDHGGMRAVVLRRRGDAGVSGYIRIDEYVYQIDLIHASGRQMLRRIDVQKLGDVSRTVLFPNLKIEPPGLSND